MTYFKGTDRAIYVVDSQRLGQHNIFIALWSLQSCWPTAGCSNTGQYVHRSLRDTNQLINTPLPGLYGVLMHLCVTTYSPGRGVLRIADILGIINKESILHCYIHCTLGRGGGQLGIGIVTVSV